MMSRNIYTAAIFAPFVSCSRIVEVRPAAASQAIADRKALDEMIDHAGDELNMTSRDVIDEFGITPSEMQRDEADSRGAVGGEEPGEVREHESVDERQGFDFMGTPKAPDEEQTVAEQQDPTPQNPWLMEVGNLLLGQVQQVEHDLLRPAATAFSPTQSDEPSQAAVDAALAGCPGILNIPAQVQVDAPMCSDTNSTKIAGTWRDPGHEVPLVAWRSEKFPLADDSLIFEVLTDVSSTGQHVSDEVATTENIGKPYFGEADIGVYDCFGRHQYTLIERVFVPSVNHEMPVEEEAGSTQSLVEWRLYNAVTGVVVARTSPPKVPVFSNNLTLVDTNGTSIATFSRRGDWQPGDDCPTVPKRWVVDFPEESRDERSMDEQHSLISSHPTSLRHVYNRWVSLTFATLVVARDNRRDLDGTVPAQSETVYAWIEVLAIISGTIAGLFMFIWLTAYCCGRSIFRNLRKFEQKFLISIVEDDSVGQLPMGAQIAEMTRTGPAPSSIRF